MKSVSPANLDAYLDTYIDRKFGLLVTDRFFQATVLSVIPMPRGNYACTILKIQDVQFGQSDGVQYSCLMPGYIPKIGDLVECIRRDRFVSYILWPTNRATVVAGGLLGYAEVTANQGGIVGGVDLTGLSVTATTSPGRRIKITAYVQAQSTVAADVANMSILVDGVTNNYVNSSMVSANVNQGFSTVSVIQPAAGSHVFKLQLGRNGGTGTLTMVAFSNAPAFILVEDVGV